MEWCSTPICFKWSMVSWVNSLELSCLLLPLSLLFCPCQTSDKFLKMCFLSTFWTSRSWWPSRPNTMTGFIFVPTFFCPKKKMFTFSRAHSHALTNATTCHEYSRGLSRLLTVPGVLVSFLELHILRKVSLWALGGHPQPLKKPSQSQKEPFLHIKINVLNDTKTSELSKSERGIFVIVCGICQSVDKKSKIPNNKTGLKKHANVDQK